MNLGTIQTLYYVLQYDCNLLKIRL
ncbi:hypothetical protein IM043_gp018 [Bacillus phage SPG24]|nr:hypothetical protein IM043_gp018 [Bacillus phage SPG24]